MLATANETLGTFDYAAAGQGGLALADRPQRVSPRKKSAPTAGSVCLVVSPDPLKQMMFGQAAQRAGWKQAVCADQTSAMEKLATGTVGLILVDTATPNPNTAADRRLLVELLSGQTELLTVVCGRTSDPSEEIWARENGAWMYLPGVAPESDLDPVLSGAKEVADRLRQRRSAAAAGVGAEF